MKRRYKNRTGIGIIVLVVLVICGIVAYKRVDLNAQNTDLLKKQEVLESQIIDQQEKETEIESLRAYAQTKQYIEDIARKKLGLVYKDEIIFKSEE